MLYIRNVILSFNEDVKPEYDMSSPLTPDIHRQEIGDATLEYLYYPGDGPTIIFLHATGFSPWIWHPIAREFAPRYKVLIPYFSDHRTSSPENGGLHWMILADDIHEFCRVLKIDRPFFVGHSMGATVTTLIEAYHGPYAEKIILIEPIFLPDGVYTADLKVEQHPLAAKAIKRKNYWEDKETARRYLKSKQLFKVWDEEMLDMYIQYGMVPDKTGALTLACPPVKEASLFMGGSHRNPWPLLPGITTPTLVIEGEKSENRPFIDLKKAASLFPNGSYRLISGAGHLIPMEKPALTRKIIQEFFDGKN